jgi:hypothetical protein
MAHIVCSGGSPAQAENFTFSHFLGDGSQEVRRSGLATTAVALQPTEWYFFRELPSIGVTASLAWRQPTKMLTEGKLADVGAGLS